MGVAVALSELASVVPPFSMAVPLMLPALPPHLVVMAPVTVGSPSWGKERKKSQSEID